MRNKLTHILKYTSTAFMLMLFVGYYVDVNFFAHTHIINGVTIVHSHFHDKHHSDTDNGGHTVSEIALIANMAAQFLTTGEIAQTEPVVFDTQIQTLGCEQESQTTSIHLSCPSLRAPPSCSTPRS